MLSVWGVSVTAGLTAEEIAQLPESAQRAVRRFAAWLRSVYGEKAVHGRFEAVATGRKVAVIHVSRTIVEQDF